MEPRDERVVMTQTTIRQLYGDEMLEVMYGLDAYAFQASPPLTDKAEWQEVVRHREGVTYFALFEDNVPVAGVAATAMTQQVRGAMFGTGGIWAVATAPAARRKGYSRRVLARLLASLREEGRPLSCLYPFRESFYERLGYVTFPLPRTARFAPSALLPLLEQDLGGQVELVLIGDGFDTYREYLRRLQRRVHGMAMFDELILPPAQRESFWLALARVAGELVGLMMYSLRGEEVTKFNLRAIRFYHDTSQGKYLLLAWIARHVDQADRVELWLPPFEQPETWLADLQVTTESAIRAPMGRIVDVAKVGGMRTGSGRFAAHVSDPLCPWNEGVWRFETVGGLLKVSAADGEKADCNLSIQALAALVYGTHDPGDFLMRGWGTPSLEVQESMRAMFPPMLPYLHEHF
jgi:predicted acetyltransferase